MLNQDAEMSHCVLLGRPWKFSETATKDFIRDVSKFAGPWWPRSRASLSHSLVRSTNSADVELQWRHWSLRLDRLGKIKGLKTLMNFYNIFWVFEQRSTDRGKSGDSHWCSWCACREDWISSSCHDRWWWSWTKDPRRTGLFGDYLEILAGDEFNKLKGWVNR